VQQKGELLGQHVAGLQIGDEQDVGIPGHWRLDALGGGRLGADCVVEGERSVEDAAADLAALGHLAQARSVDGGGNLAGHGLHRGKDRHFWRCEPQPVGEVDGVLADVDLVFQGGKDVHRRVGDEQRLVVGRYVHDEDVADAPLGAQARRPGHDFGHQLVGVQAALHEQPGLATTNHLDGAGGGGVAVRHVDDGDVGEVDVVFLRDRLDLVARSDQGRQDQPQAQALGHGAQDALFAGMGDRRRHRLKPSCRRDQVVVAA